jgi:hypothetical protein
MPPPTFHFTAGATARAALRSASPAWAARSDGGVRCATQPVGTVAACVSRKQGLASRANEGEELSRNQQKLSSFSSRRVHYPREENVSQGESPVGVRRVPWGGVQFGKHPKSTPEIGVHLRSPCKHPRQLQLGLHRQLPCGTISLVTRYSWRWYRQGGLDHRGDCEGVQDNTSLH